MKKLLLIFLLVFPLVTFAQLNNDLIAIGKAYHGGVKNDSIANSLNKYATGELVFTTHFIQQLKTADHETIYKKWLSRPLDKDLKLIYIVEQVNFNTFAKPPIDDEQLVEDLEKKDIPVYELLHTYYEMLFSVYDSTKPYDMSAIDFKLNDYGLKDDGEKSIVFLESMAMNGTLIWGYMNIPKPPNYAKAIEYIDHYPKFNGSPYYRYENFDLTDFDIEIGGKKQSYKQYYLSRFYQTLLSDLLSRSVTHADKDKITELVSNSILVQEKYFKYSKDHELLEKLYKGKQ